MTYFEKEDVLHLAISDEAEVGSVEVSPNITAELNAKGELIGIEILGASNFIRDSVLESVQARVLDLAEAKSAGQTPSWASRPHNFLDPFIPGFEGNRPHYRFMKLPEKFNHPLGDRPQPGHLSVGQIEKSFCINIQIRR